MVSFDTEACCDFLSLGAGLDPSDNTSVVGVLAGNWDDIPQKVFQFNSSSDVWLRFVTDEYIGDEGFVIIAQVIPNYELPPLGTYL